ncbi:unnamed protein product, partial [Mesorhabditis belari]|uniref:G-protein coupled receptors family 1 profile domain-containing protein n=1 Tax=Mesorhabditis belari TaxID=2138241 RepID=A0AAF3EU34_9BILA
MTSTMTTRVLEFDSLEAYLFWEENCMIISPGETSFIVIGVIGCSVAGLSVVFNTFLFWLLMKNRKHRSSHLLYLTFLAAFDIFVSIAYILLFPINIYVDYFESVVLANAWYTYMPLTLSISHVMMTASALLIVAAAFERFVTISKIRTQFAKRNRYLISILCLIFAIFPKAPMFFEIEVVKNFNCTGASQWRPNQIDWIESETLQTLYKFWFRNIVITCLPFFLCFYLNIQIIRRLRLQHQGAKLFRFATSEHRQNIRAATLMLVCVTCSYLASNLPNVILYILEMFDMDFLWDPAIRPYYSYVSDLVSLLTVTSCFLRLPIYYACNARIRSEVLEVFDNWLNFFSPQSLHGIKAKRPRPNTTVRYCPTDQGFMIFEKTASRRGDLKPKCYGTGLDKVVLSVALTGMDGALRRASAHARLGDAQEATDMDLLRPVFYDRRQSDQYS